MDGISVGAPDGASVGVLVGVSLGSRLSDGASLGS